MASAPRVLVLNERDSHHPKAGGAEVHVDGAEATINEGDTIASLARRLGSSADAGEPTSAAGAAPVSPVTARAANADKVKPSGLIISLLDRRTFSNPR